MILGLVGIQLIGQGWAINLINFYQGAHETHKLHQRATTFPLKGLTSIFYWGVYKSLPNILVTAQ